MAFVTPVVEHWLEQEIPQWVHPMKDRSDDPPHHEHERGQANIQLRDVYICYIDTHLSSPVSFFVFFTGHEYFVEIDLSAKEQLTTGRIFVTLVGAAGQTHTVEFTR